MNLEITITLQAAETFGLPVGGSSQTRPRRIAGALFHVKIKKKKTDFFL